jgi:peptide chain release factor 1
MNLRPYIEKFARRLGEVEAALSDPKLFENPPNLRRCRANTRASRSLTGGRRRYLKVRTTWRSTPAFLKTEPADSELAQLAREEIAQLKSRNNGWPGSQFGLAPPDPADSRNTIIEIRAGAGGSESALFAADLYRMYTRYAEPRLEG